VYVGDYINFFASDFSPVQFKLDTPPAERRVARLTQSLHALVRHFLEVPGSIPVGSDGKASKGQLSR